MYSVHPVLHIVVRVLGIIEVENYSALKSVCTCIRNLIATNDHPKIKQNQDAEKYSEQRIRRDEWDMYARKTQSKKIAQNKIEIIMP